MVSFYRRVCSLSSRSDPKSDSTLRTETRAASAAVLPARAPRGPRLPPSSRRGRGLGLVPLPLGRRRRDRAARRRVPVLAATRERLRSAPGRLIGFGAPWPSLFTFRHSGIYFYFYAVPKPTVYIGQSS